MLLLEILRKILVETMSYQQLFHASTPARVKRSKNVRVTQLPATSTRNGKYWSFRFKSNPSTTGKGWEGRISFPRTKTRVANRIDRLTCEVDCSCFDYKFRWAYANNNLDAGPMGSKSLNKCNGNPPVEMNPSLQPGLCKHLLALRDGLHQRLKESQQPTLESKLDEIVDKYPRFEVTYEE